MKRNSVQSILSVNYDSKKKINEKNRVSPECRRYGICCCFRFVSFFLDLQVFLLLLASQKAMNSVHMQALVSNVVQSHCQCGHKIKMYPRTDDCYSFLFFFFISIRYRNQKTNTYEIHFTISRYRSVDRSNRVDRISRMNN